MIVIVGQSGEDFKSLIHHNCNIDLSLEIQSASTSYLMSLGYLSYKLLATWIWAEFMNLRSRRRWRLRGFKYRLDPSSNLDNFPEIEEQEIDIFMSNHYTWIYATSAWESAISHGVQAWGSLLSLYGPLLDNWFIFANKREVSCWCWFGEDLHCWLSSQLGLSSPNYGQNIVF